MSAQLDSDLPYQVIRLGGMAAAAVPPVELRRLRALERIASPDELAEAESAARAEDLDAREEAGRPGELPDEEAGRILGVSARLGDEEYVAADEVRRLLGMPRCADRWDAGLGMAEGDFFRAPPGRAGERDDQRGAHRGETRRACSA